MIEQFQSQEEGDREWARWEYSTFNDDFLFLLFSNPHSLCDGYNWIFFLSFGFPSQSNNRKYSQSFHELCEFRCKMWIFKWISLENLFTLFANKWNSILFSNEKEWMNEKIILTLGVLKRKKNEAYVLKFDRIASHLMNEIGSLLKAR